MAIVGLVGSGGFAREVMPLLQRMRQQDASMGELVFVVPERTDELVNGVRQVSEDDFLNTPGKRSFNIAIADSRLRERIATLYESRGCEPLSVRASESLAYDACDIAPGAIFCAYTMVTSNAKIGRYFHANIYSYVAHDCIVGDFVTFAPGVKCNGNVVIEDHAYIGTGAILRHGTPDKPLRIGAGAVVGMGAVVTKDVAPGTTVVGSPARPLAR